MPKDSSDNLLDHLFQHVAATVRIWALWKRLYMTADEVQIRRMRGLSEFLVIVQQLTQQRVILYLSVLRDSGGKFGFAKVAKAWNKRLDATTSRNLQASIDKFKSLSGTIVRHRNERIAHLDATLRFGDENLPAVKIQDADQCVTLAIEILNCLQKHAGGTPSDFTGLLRAEPAGHLLSLLERAETWRQLRTNYRELTTEEIVLSVKQGVYPPQPRSQRPVG